MDDNIIAEIKNRYGLTCQRITPITGGLLNQKWKVSTEKGELLVKQYSSKRFPKEKLTLIESRLQRQIALEKSGIPCIHRCADGVRVLYGDGFLFRQNREQQHDHSLANGQSRQYLRSNAQSVFTLAYAC